MDKQNSELAKYMAEVLNSLAKLNEALDEIENTYCEPEELDDSDHVLIRAQMQSTQARVNVENFIRYALKHDLLDPKFKHGLELIATMDALKGGSGTTSFVKRYFAKD